MLRKHVSLLIFCAFLSFPLEAQHDKYGVGDLVFVWASSLNLREIPSPEGKIIEKVPYGAQVIMVADELTPIACVDKALEPVSIENQRKSKPFYIKGYWAKVNFEGTIGYVFDGYLSKIRPIKRGEDKFALLEHWATHFLKLSPQKMQDPANESAWTEYRGKADQIRVQVGYESKAAIRKVWIKNISFDEACMLGIKLFDAHYLLELKEGKAVFKSYDANGDCEITILKQGAWMVLLLECTC